MTLKHPLLSEHGNPKVNREDRSRMREVDSTLNIGSREERILEMGIKRFDLIKFFPYCASKVKQCHRAGNLYTVEATYHCYSMSLQLHPGM